MAPISKDASIAFIGLGNLGQAMSLNLADQAWPLRVLDTVTARMTPVIELGAQPLAVENVADCQVICIAVSDEIAIRAVLEGPGGLLPRLTAEHTVISHSTILPKSAKEIGSEIAATGARFLDAPVSGGAERARAGKLTLFVGGNEDDLADVHPLLSAMAEDIVHVGPVGAGSATKLANQLIMFASLSGVYEGLALASAFGVSEESVLKAVATSTGDTWVGRNWGFFDRVVADYNRNGTPVSQRPWSKDLWEIVSAARDSGLSLPVAGLLAEILADAVERHAGAHSEEERAKS